MDCENLSILLDYSMLCWWKVVVEGGVISNRSTAIACRENKLQNPQPRKQKQKNGRPKK